MTDSKCLACYRSLEAQQVDFHPRCSTKIFGTTEPPMVEISLLDVQDLAKKLVNARQALTGVQPKLSVDQAKKKAPPHGESKGSSRRLTLMRGANGLSGHYILKPPTARYPHVPEIEDATMHLAQLCKLRVAQHSLIRLRSGELAYLTKRFDRTKTGKLAVEDMAQITEVLTEYKYNSSLERVGKAIKKFSDNPGFDVLNFLDLVIFCYLTGNADMHLKNFSLLTDEDGMTGLAPAYDLVATKLIIPDDLEETALPLNGKKSNLRLNDFYALADLLGVAKTVFAKRLAFFASNIDTMTESLGMSFLPEELMQKYLQLVQQRAAHLGLSSF